MQIQGAGYVNSSSSVYAYSPSYANCASESAGISTQDNASISAFSGESDSGAAQDAGALQSQKAQAESELSSIKGKADEVHAQISTRKDEVNKEQNSDQACSDQQAEYDAAKAEYDQASAAKSEAQQRSSQINQENSANEQAISANSQQKQQVSSNIASVQSQLASLTPPSAPGGEDSEGQAAYQAQLAAYNAQKSALQSQLAALQQQLQQLEAQAQQLQAKKAQLAGEQQQVQAQSAQQDAAMQSAQAKMDAAQQAMGANDPELQQAWEDDAELQSLQNEYDQLQQEQAQLEAEISQLDAQIAEAEANEAKDAELQAARADEADQTLQTAAEQAGCDIAGAEAKAQDAAAQEKFGKGYAELSEDEQLEIAAEVDGAVTLELMDSARRMLKDDPDNAAAQAVLEKGQASLEAQENLAYAELSSSIDNLPAGLQDGAASSMAAARAMAVVTGGDPEKAATEALAKYASQHADDAEMSAEEKASLQEVVGASGNYLSSIEKNDQGQQLVQSAEAEAKVKDAVKTFKDGLDKIAGGNGTDKIIAGGKGTDKIISGGEGNDKIISGGKGLDSLKDRVHDFIDDTVDKAKRWKTDNFGTDAEKLEQAMDDAGVDKENVVYINGTDGDDTIDVKIGKDGSYTVTVNGEESVYSAEEAQRLMIDGGDGNDHITIHGEEKENPWIGIPIGGLLGSDGSDVVKSPDGTDAPADGGSGDDFIKDFITGGMGSDVIQTPQPAIFINGGDGNDIIDATDNVNTQLYMTGGYGDDELRGGNADDVIIDNYGSNTINGGDGNDQITAMGLADPQSLLDRGLGWLHGNRGTVSNTIEGGRGDDVINTGDGDDIITDMGGNNEIHAGGGDDEITLSGYGDSQVYGDDGNDTINVNSRGYSEIHGGDGIDTMTATNGNHKLYGDGGDDIMKVDISPSSGLFNSSFIELHGGDGSDTLTSVHGNHALYGEDGDDTINGGDGRDYIEGGDGDDIIDGGEGGDVIYGGDGNDTVKGGDGDDFINAGHGDDTVYGGEGNDTMFGLAGNDRLYGEGGMDTIASGDGNDTVDGGDGADIIRYTDSLFHGHDNVINQDEEDDVRALNPIAVPDNFKVGTKYYEGDTVREMSPEEAQAFENLINDNLEAFACIEPGQQLLQGIAETGHTVTYEALGDQNGYCSKPVGKGDAEITETDGVRSYKPGTGTDSTVKINPSFISFSSDSPYKEQNTMVIMAHEMCHAYNNATGTMDQSFYNNDTGEWMDLPEGTSTEEGWNQRAIRGAELQAVGIYDNSTVYANPYGMSENDYRQYFHMAPRTSYMGQSSTILNDPNTKHGEVANTHLNENGQYVFDEKIDWDSIDLTRPSLKLALKNVLHIIGNIITGG